MTRQQATKWAGVGLMAVVLCGVSGYIGALRSSGANQDPLKPFDKVPEGQSYVGPKVCAACHLDQHTDWRKTYHSKGFKILPAKYHEDKSCLKCHATGTGEPTGFKNIKETPDLGGTSCEKCHGPGSKHVELAKKYIGKDLNAAEEKFVRSSIHNVKPWNVCVECHITKGHKPHPDYD